MSKTTENKPYNSVPADCRILTWTDAPPVALDPPASLSLNCWHRAVSASCSAKNISRLALVVASSNLSFSRIILESMDMLVVVEG